MSKTKKLTLTSVMAAMGVVFMLLGSVIEVMDLSVCALVSLIVVFVYLEVGVGHAWAVYLCTSLLSFLIVPAKLMCFEYLLMFGIYPLLKAFIEKLPRISWIFVKLVFVNAMIWLIFLVAELWMGFIFLEGDTFILKAALYVFMNVTFVVYDIFITVMVRFYYDRIRPRIKRILK